MGKVLIILCPPHSFSSVVSTMIGQHPELYGFPELNLFSSNSVQQIINAKSPRGKIASPGLIRTLAQEHEGIQTSETILRAIDWVLERKDWSTQQLFEYLIDLISPKIGVEATPTTCKKKKYLERAYNWCPNAYFLHLTRHPVSTHKSIKEFFAHRDQKKNSWSKKEGNNLTDGFFVWYYMQKNIVNFTNSLPVGQTMRLKGEDLLSQSDLYLPQIATWLGVSSEPEAIAAMKHPENSPYAYVGPSPCLGGNDPTFMRNPTLRNGKINEPSLTDFLAQEKWQWTPSQIEEFVQQENLPLVTPEKLTQDLTELANVLGYS